jgi:putative ABC transport system ATP-binding protein
MNHNRNLGQKTSEEIMKLFNDIHAHGNTVICHHEGEVAVARIIRLRDGNESDIWAAF